ncbi:MAG: hypothetical protein RLZZ316_2351 [Bacteroidota bacterium]
MNHNRHQHITDTELLEHFYSSHDNQWLGILLERYTLLLYGVCMKYLKNEDEAKDGVQQIFLKAIAELHKYKVDYFKSWVYMVAKNYCLMQLRNKPGKTPLSLTNQDVAGDETADELQQHLQKDQLLELMANSLSELNKEQQQCITLFYLEKRSYNEIAGTTGFSMMQVKSYIQNGKRNLKLLIEKKMK